MLLGFASAWPVNILKAWRARTARGTSLGFMLVVEFAYVCGIMSKVVGDDITYVLLFYLLDFGLVAIALMVYLRNRRIDSGTPQGPEQ